MVSGARDCVSLLMPPLSAAGRACGRHQSSIPRWAGMPAWKTLSSKRSEEHTSELQSHLNLVCRLLLEKKKKQKNVKTQTYGEIVGAIVKQHTHTDHARATPSPP